MRKSMLALSAALLLTATGSAWLWSQWNSERARNRELQSRLDVLVREQLVQHSASRSPAGLAPDETSALPSQAPPSAPARVVDKVQDDPWSREQRLMQDPQYQAAMRRQQRSLIEFSFRELPRALHLDADQANRVFDALAEQAVHRMLGSTEVQKIADEARLTELLGESGNQQLKEFRESMPSRLEANQLRSTLVDAGAPLREDQFKPLLAVVRVEQRRFQLEVQEHLATDQPQGYDTRTVELRNATNERILRASQSFLTASQFTTLESYYRNQRQISEAVAATATLQIEQSIRDPQVAKGN
jgi:hypothetical protein